MSNKKNVLANIIISLVSYIKATKNTEAAAPIETTAEETQAE